MSIDDQDLHDELARVAEELHRTAELIDASDGWWAADDGVDAVHSIVRSSAHALRALAGWYDRCSEQIFDERLGAEQDATKAVAAADRALRAFAAELEAVAERHAGLVAEVDHLDHHDLIRTGLARPRRGPRDLRRAHRRRRNPPERGVADATVKSAVLLPCGRVAQVFVPFGRVRLI